MADRIGGHLSRTIWQTTLTDKVGRQWYRWRTTVADNLDKPSCGRPLQIKLPIIWQIMLEDNLTESDGGQRWLTTLTNQVVDSLCKQSCRSFDRQCWRTTLVDTLVEYRCGQDSFIARNADTCICQAWHTRQVIMNHWWQARSHAT